MSTSLTTSPGSSRARNESRPILSVIIVTWNVADMLRDCLKSLENDGVPDWAEVIVVDNASRDDTAALVRRDFPWAILLENAANLGYSRGNNVGIRAAHGDHFLLLNPDTIVHAGSLRVLVDFAISHPEAGIVGPKHFTGSGEIHYECASEFPTVWNVFCDLSFLSRVFARSRLFNGRLLGYWDHLNDREVPAIPGAAMLVGREVIQTVGLLDETMFYAEDMDFCMRVREAGWKIFYLASASIVHLGGVSTKRAGDFGFHRKIAFQSFWLFTRKHHGRVVAAMLSTMVFGWSLCAVTLGLCLSVVFRRDTPAGETVRVWRSLAHSLLQWSIGSKRRFRHHLAAAPQI